MNSTQKRYKDYIEQAAGIFKSQSEPERSQTAARALMQDAGFVSLLTQMHPQEAAATDSANLKNALLADIRVIYSRSATDRIASRPSQTMQGMNR